MSKRIEDTRTGLNHDSANTKQDFRAFAAQVQHDAGKSKAALKHFAEEVQRALAQSASGATGTTRPSGRPVSLKETSVDRPPEEVSRADFSNWVEELYVHVEGVDEWASRFS